MSDADQNPPKTPILVALRDELVKHVLPAFSALIGAILLAFVVVVVLLDPYPSGMFRWILLVFGSLAAAGLSAFVSGSLKVDGKAPNLNISATGSFAVFIVCMWVGNSWTASSQYIALSAEDISERFTGKTIVYHTGTHEYHGPDNTTEIYRNLAGTPDDERHQQGKWFVSSDGTRGIIQYSYLKNGTVKTTCTSNILHNAANDSYITHQISGSCGSRVFSVSDANTAKERAEQWAAFNAKKKTQNSQFLAASEISDLLSDMTIKYPTDSRGNRTLEYHGPNGALDIARRNGRREQGIWRTEDKNGRGVITYCYQRDGGAEITCVANIKDKTDTKGYTFETMFGTCSSSEIVLLEGNQLGSQTAQAASS